LIELDFLLTEENVPILSNQEIDWHVGRLLEDYDKGLLTTPQILNVDDFVENYIGLNLHYENLSNNSCIWGRMIFDKRQIPIFSPETNCAEWCPIDANTIIIDNSLLDEDKEMLYRSTVMHECGHGLYHKSFFHGKDCADDRFLAASSCRPSDIAGNKLNGRRKFETPIEWIEHHAKYFSAAILMNSQAMNAALDKFNKMRDIEEEINSILEVQSRKPHKILEHLFFMHEKFVFFVATTFGVSEISARIRIQQLNLKVIPDDMKLKIEKVVML